MRATRAWKHPERSTEIATWLRRRVTSGSAFCWEEVVRRLGRLDRWVEPGHCARAMECGGATMTDSLEAAKQMVEKLIATANRVHRGATWSYELTSEVDNIEVKSQSTADAQILRIHPCWLRYVVAQGEFKSCVADEIEAWHLLEQLTGPVPAPR